MKKLVLVLTLLGLASALALPALAAEPIRIGVPTTLSIFQGDECLKAATLAAEEINAAGGVEVAGTKRKIEIIPSDLRDALPGVPVAEALMGLEKMILDDKVDAMVVGPVRSEALLPAMDILAKYKKPMMGTTAMSPATQKKIAEEPEKYKYLFRPALNAPYLVGYVAGSLKHLKKKFGLTKLFSMVQDVMWARMTADFITKAAAKDGWESVGLEAFPTGASDFTPGLMKAQANGAQVILTFFDMPTSGILVKQWATMRVPALLNGDISPMAGPKAWETYDKGIAGALNAVFEIGNIPVAKVPESVRFWEAYKKRWGAEIQAPHGPAASYESVRLLAEAMTRAGSTDGSAVADEMRKTDRPGVMGRIRFDKTNQLIFGQDPKEAALGCIFQWRDDGSRAIVYPETIADEDVLLPEWMK